MLDPVLMRMDEINEALVYALGFGPDGAPLSTDPLRLEITNVAAAMNRLPMTSHLRYKKIGPSRFQPAKTTALIPPNPDEFFEQEPAHLQPGNKQSATEQRDEFWMLTKTRTSVTMQGTLLVMLHRLAEMGVGLTHEGKKVTNFGVANAGIDVETAGNPFLEKSKHAVIQFEDEKKTVIPLLPTHKSLNLIRALPDEQKAFFPGIEFRQPRNVAQERAHRLEAQKLGLKDEDSVVRHHWCVAELETGETVHIDLNGPSWGVFEYVSVKESETKAHDVPVSYRVLPKGVLKLSPVSGGEILSMNYDEKTKTLSFSQFQKPVADGPTGFELFFDVAEWKKIQDAQILDWPCFSCLKRCTKTAEHKHGTMQTLSRDMDMRTDFGQIYANCLEVLSMVMCACQRLVKNRVTASGLQSEKAQRLNNKRGLLVHRGAGDKRGWIFASRKENKEGFFERWEVKFQGEAEPVKVKPENIRLGWLQKVPEKQSSFGGRWEMQVDLPEDVEVD
ncbi:unnamed protein product [Amoebophrya sp. A120]|nr:unnamed protein product [Amoebophrya sp. A120]|eukprot:GSA120T00020823001.1